MNRIWAYDPGDTTGWALFARTPGREYPATLIQWGEMRLWEDLERQIRRGDEVVHESLYVLSPGFNPIGMEVVGVIKYLCRKYGITPHKQHTGLLAGPYKWPGSTKVHKMAKSDHAYDAILHGVVYLKFQSLDGLLNENS